MFTKALAQANVNEEEFYMGLIKNVIGKAKINRRGGGGKGKETVQF